MSQPSSFPHVYYTIQELSTVKNVKIMKTVNIKTVGLISDDFAYEIDFEKNVFEKGTARIKLDLTHINNLTGMKPYLIFGVLYTLNQSPIICVKTVKELGTNFANLILYHHQLLEIRKRNNYFEVLKNLNSEKALS